MTNNAKHVLILQEQINSDYLHVAGMVDKSMDALLTAGTCTEKTGRCKLALTEAINNVIEHAYQENPEEIVDLKILLSDEEIVFHLTDTGLTADPSVFEGNTFALPDDELATGGWGLYLIHEIMDDINYYSLDGQNHLVFIKWRDVQ